MSYQKQLKAVISVLPELLPNVFMFIAKRKHLLNTKATLSIELEVFKTRGWGDGKSSKFRI